MHQLHLQHYVSDRQVPRSKIFLPQSFFSFLEQGEKIVHYANDCTTVTANQFVLLSSGNCLMTEKLPQNYYYRSTMLFFDNVALTTFLVKHASIPDGFLPEADNIQKPFLVFEKDQFIKTYISSLLLLLSKPAPFLNKMLQLKFEELMLYLLEKYPREVVSFQAGNQGNDADFHIRKAVELNITTNLSLEELAFLCHTSVSTFKRKFVKLYNETPGRYFLKQKMELAKNLLLQNEKPGEVFYKVGYENHSAFSQSFKQVYGVSPSEFQQQYLTV